MDRLGLKDRRWTRPLAWLATLALGAALGAAACTAAGDGKNGGDDDDDGGTGNGSGGAGGSASTGSAGEGGNIFSTGTGTGTGTGSAGCSEAAKLIYIIGENNNLYSFHPPTLEVKPIGVINCPQGGFATPFSMAVDRKGTAWILFNDGNIYHVDTATAACAATGFQPNQQGLSTFGMGFVSDAAGSEAETLFIADYYGSGIATIDTTTLAVSPVRPYNDINTAAELTGTGDARLFGFFQGSPIIIAEIDRLTGNILSQAPQPTINIGAGWAFAFWGGDFYTFTNPDLVSSQIDRYQPSTGVTSTVLTNIGDNIVGAGVSTCAPTEPPE